MCATVFGLDTEPLEADHPGLSWNNAAGDVKRHRTARGFTSMQGSAYCGGDRVDAVRCGRVVQKPGRKHAGFTPSVRDIRKLRIADDNDLRIALDDDDD